MLTDDVNRKKFEGGGATVIIERDNITRTVKVGITVPDKLGSVSQITDMIDLLTETKEEIENDTARKSTTA